MNKIQTTEIFAVWFDALRDRNAKARIQARIDRAEEGNFGDCLPWEKAYPKCAFITERAIGCISSGADANGWCFWPEGTNPLSRLILKPR